MVPEILFNAANVVKCLCTKCPVQAKSECVKDKMGGMKEAMLKNPLHWEDVPGMYCATGRATCTDIDTSLMCKCMGCPIWEESRLAEGVPMGYFCRDGASK